MATVYRVIKISMDSDESMDRQLDNSLADGIHCAGKTGLITIGTFYESESAIGEQLGRLISGIKDTGINGCITKKQLRELRRREESFTSK